MDRILRSFNRNMSNNDFVINIIQLDNMDNGQLSEHEEDVLSDFYNKLSTICPVQIESNLNNTTFLLNRNETIGDFMYFLKMIWR